jgi:lipid-A-disaccharide synthase
VTPQPPSAPPPLAGVGGGGTQPTGARPAASPHPDLPPQAGEGVLIFVVAGEPSGDALGAALIRGLRQRTLGRVRFAGIGGEEMAKEGVASLVPLDELAIMGVAEVLPRARRILARVRETVEAIVRLKPAAVVTIDSSGFSWRIAQRLRGRGETLPLIHYVAPMVWAWRAGRARRMARWYNHLMALLPFEPPYFEKVGLPCAYVGHPVIESGADKGDGTAFRARHGIPEDVPLLCVLPGSRRGEVARLLPVFRATLERLTGAVPGLRIVVPTVANVADAVRAGTEAWPVPVLVVAGTAEKYDAFAAAQAALAASGTVALELAMAGLPMVVAYRANPFTAWLLRRVVKVPYANLVNLVLGRLVVPELLLEDCTPERLSSAVERLLCDAAARTAQRAGFAEAMTRLGRGGPSPSLRAADEVLAVIARQATAP